MITTAFVRKFEGLVKSVVHEAEKDPQKFEDLVQDVWLEICKSAHIMPKDEAAYSTWVTEIAKRTCRRHAKASANEVEVILDSAMAPPATDDESAPEGSWIEGTVPAQQTAEDEQLLEELIMRGATLSEQENAVFNLVYWHGQSYAAVAKKLGVTVEHVGVVCNHLRNKLEVKDLYHNTYTYHAPGAVWGDWAWKPEGPGNQRMLAVQLGEGPDKYCYTLPNGDCVGGTLAGFPACMHDVMEKYNNGKYDCKG